MRKKKASRKQKKQQLLKHPSKNKKAFGKITKLPSQTVWQIFKFAIVGGLATSTHAGLFVFIIENKIASAMQANFIAFAVAFLISFLGQYHWTFRNSSDSHWAKKMAKFMIVALIGLGLNTSAVFIIVDQLSLSYLYAVLFMTTVVPVSTFVINKKWAFS
jgi:putative flippase GtrA